MSEFEEVDTQSSETPAGTAASVEMVEAAKSVGLRYVVDTGPGIRRRRAGRSFRYYDEDGAPIRDRVQLRRLKALAIPPAYKDVWICPLWNGHLQATARDARGRKQYRYHPRWREARDSNKFERVILFGESLPTIRQRVQHDLSRPGMPREKVLATIVQLLESSLIRVGNEEYARSNKSFGLTTLRNRHVDVHGSNLQFHFRGKSGKRHIIDVKDRRLARIIRRLQDLPGQELFEYVDDAGQIHTVHSQDVNGYLKEISGHDFTAKDFRTWAGTALAAVELAAFGCCESVTEAKKNIASAIESVSKRLGNTRAICRKCYVHPAILEAYLNGSLDRLPMIEGASKGAAAPLQGCETAVLALLRGAGA
ncbi:MAG TPA: DNA topoisomerase IB [Armatimonadota bacterium]|nr:DNA topoisomerase IB [Armatimonadota bacterium]